MVRANKTGPEGRTVVANFAYDLGRVDVLNFNTTLVLFSLKMGANALGGARLQAFGFVVLRCARVAVPPAEPALRGCLFWNPQLVTKSQSPPSEKRTERLRRSLGREAHHGHTGRAGAQTSTMPAKRAHFYHPIAAPSVHNENSFPSHPPVFDEEGSRPWVAHFELARARRAASTHKPNKPKAWY